MKSGLIGAVASIAIGGFSVASYPGEIRLSGAGATFPAPLYTRWVSEYQRAHPSVKIDYRSIGSGGGVKALADKTVAFGATDAPLNEKEIAAMGGTDAVVQFPATLGAVVPAYNLPGVKEPLHFTGAVLVDIYLGRISSWDDAQLQKLNPDVKLPKTPITPAFRTDGSGTTHVFTSYLGTQSPVFKAEIGVGKQVKWPLGQGGKGNEGVAAVIQQTVGSIGYIEHNYAIANKISFGAVQNKVGKFVLANAESVSAAGDETSGELRGDILRADAWNAPGEKAYPISAFTYIVLYKHLENIKTQAEAEALLGYLRWTLGPGQKLSEAMYYSPLSEKVRSAALGALNSVTHDGKPVLVQP
ncbi:MAG: phosphate ABC transporter substrate-binding protein PstS [Phycisphaeraceae bacterium]|nr:phosphate ABC transporter substrate-binding protein PstS [Phycisphaeraceae bacterium]